MRFSITGQRILITGASRGIGAALARSAASRAGKLLLVARSSDELAALAAELPCPTQVLSCDLVDPAQRAELLELLASETVDVLVNNAGVTQWGPFHENDRGQAERLLELNARVPMDLTRALLPPMVARGHGAVLTIGSVTGYLPLPYHSVYAASKAFVNSFAVALAWELRGTGVTSTLVSPGATRTDLFRAGGVPQDRMIKMFQEPEAVAREAWWALERGRASRITGFRNRVLMRLARHAPQWLTGRVAYRVFAPSSGTGCR